MPHSPFLTAVVATPDGDIFDLEGYAAVGMAGGQPIPIPVAESRPLPHGGELMFLPKRRPVVYDIAAGRIETLRENPYDPSQPLHPVAAFNSPGFVQAYVTAYEEEDPEDFLPLFSYGAVGWHGNGFYTPVIRVDENRARICARCRARKSRPESGECGSSCPKTGFGGIWNAAPWNTDARRARIFFWAGTRPPCPRPAIAMPDAWAAFPCKGIREFRAASNASTSRPRPRKSPRWPWPISDG